MMQEPPIILIGGPTASGKSAYALKMAKKRNGVIINADAMQIYQGLPILTAQPSVADKAEIRHCLYETMLPSEPSSVGIWLQSARAAIAQARAEGQTPILVGGTGFYFEALTKGLADIPSVPVDVREGAKALYAELGEREFRERLALRDPESACRIAANDKQRLIRAFEVFEATGTSLTEWQKRELDFGIRDRGGYERHLLLPPRDVLYAACDARFGRMMEKGALGEVKTLLAQNLSENLPAMKILGVPELAAYLRGGIPLDVAVTMAQQHTRNYAKRQVTWFRNRWP